MARLDLLAPDVLADPYPLLHRLRAEDPVHWDADGGCWAITRYHDALLVLRDGERFSSVIHGTDADLATARWFVFMDPPAHTRLRGLVNAAFTPRMVEALRPRIGAIVAELLGRIADASRFDVIADLAFPLPAIVIAELLGVPAEEREQFRRWSSDLAAVGGLVRMAADGRERRRRARESGEALDRYMHDIVRERRARPTDDLVSRLIATRAEGGDVLGDDELVATCVFLLFAGHETTMNLIGNGTLALLRHPGELARLRAEPALVASGVEELLRYDSPVQLRVRIARADVPLRGRRIRAGDRVLVFLGAANRDPERFVEPDRLDLGRGDNRHLAFGHGVHFCLGAPLARLEGAIALDALVHRFPSLTLASETIAWRETMSLRGLAALPVAVR